MARQKLFLTIKGKLRGVPPGTNLPAGEYVYQRTSEALANYVDQAGNRMQVRAHVPQYNPQTPGQMANRSVFATGVATYQALSESEKQEWRQAAKAHQLNGFQYYMREYMRTH